MPPTNDDSDSERGRGSDREDTVVATHDDVEARWLLGRARERLLGRVAAEPVTIGRYRIARRLGAGGMAVVYAGRDDELDREVAIKLLRPAFATDDDWRLRLRREAQAMARLAHPNVAHVYEVGQHGEQLFIAMELIPGVTLRRWGEARPRSAAQILAMHLQAARGLAAAHAAGLVHRDYKPDNVIVDDHERARVLDFGLARPPGETIPEHEPDARTVSPLPVAMTAPGTIMGTPAYMAPEQLVGAPVDHRADQFAFCVALYEALHGRRPFSGDDVTQLAAAIRRHELPRVTRRRGHPAAIDAVLRRGLALAREDRFATMDELADALAPWAVPTHTRRRQLLAFGALALAVGGLAAAPGFVRSPPPAEAPAAVADASSADPWEDIVAASDLPNTLAQPLADDPAKVTIHRLRNGLTIYIAPKPGAPLVDTALVVRADPIDETADEIGVATVLPWLLGESDRLGSADPDAERPLLARQHAALSALSFVHDPVQRDALLLEVETARAQSRLYVVPGEAVWLAAELGMQTNIMQMGPGTVSSCVVPRNRLADWATIVAEGWRRPAFRGFLPIVRGEIEDRRERAHDAARLALEQGIAELTGWPLDDVAVAEALRGIPFLGAQRFWQTWYRPNNAAIVLVGDVSASEVVPLFERAFGDWEPAALPPRTPVEPAIAGAARVVVDDGAARVLIGWPRASSGPAADAQRGLERLLHDSSLASQWLESDGRASWLSNGPHRYYHQHPHYLEIAVAPAGDHSLAEAEAAARALLAAIAAGEIQAEHLRIAQGAAQLAALAWASASDSLALEIGRTFARRIEWGDHLVTLRGEPIDDAAIQSAAAALLEARGVTVHHRSGPPAPLDIPPLQVPDVPPPNQKSPERSAFAAAMLAAPTTPLEPQFLRPGRDAIAQPWGEGRIITVPDDGPLFDVRIAWPFGVADDPLICDAWRARLAELAEPATAAGMRFVAVCKARETAIDAHGVSARFAEAEPILASLFTAELSDESAERQVEQMLAARARVRADEWARRYAFHVVALRGEQGIDAHLPSDAALARARPADLRRAMQRSLQTAPDVLYAGPHARELRDLLPPAPLGPTRAPQVVHPRAIERTTVYLLHDATRERADVRFAIAVDTPDTHAMLLGDLSRAIRPESLPAPFRAPVARYAMPLSSGPNADGILAQEGIECPHEDVALAAANLLAEARQDPTREQVQRARTFVEGDIRSRRRAGIAAAIWMAQWAALDSTSDPYLAVWLGLGTVDDAELRAFHRDAMHGPAVITVIADLRRVPLDDLAEVGELVRVEPAALRDPELSELSVFGFYPPGVP